MSKFQEDYYYFVYEEINKDEELKALFNESLKIVNGTEKYRFSSAHEKYEASFNKAKKALVKKY